MISKKTKKELLLIISFLIFSIVFVTTVKILTGSFTYTFGSSDMHIYTAAQMKILEPELFENDVYFSEIFKTYPNTVNYFLAFLINLFGNMNMAYIFVNYLLFIIFWLGNYQLAKYIFRSKTTGIIFALLSAFGTKALFGTYWGIILGQVSTRDFVTAFVPLLLYYYLKYYKDKKKIMLLFFVIGVLTNLHFITAAVFVAILMLTEIIHEKKICVKNLIIQSSSYLLGASPFIIKGLMISKLMIPIEILHFRIGYQYFISITKVFFLFLIPTIFAFFGFSLKLKNQTTKDIIILEFFVSSILFSIIIYFISALSSFIAPLQLTRATKFIFVFLLLYMSYFINKLINMRENKIKVLGGIITLLLLIPSSYVFLTIFSSSNELIILDFRTNEIIQETQSNQEMYYEYSFESIKETSEWISKNTKKNQVIITNPQISTLFRVYAKRPIKISWKDGGNLILTRSNQSKRWYSELIKWNNLYKIGGETTYNYASNNADIFICENNKIFENKVPNFRNQDFSVYIFSKDS